MGDNKDEKNEPNFLLIAFYGAMAAASIQSSVWMHSQGQELWDRDVNGFTETDLI